MQMDFSNRNVIVLGGSDGIGFEVARQLVENNANVCIIGRSITKLENAMEQINKYSKSNSQNIYLDVDLTNPDSVEQIYNFTQKKWGGKVDSLVLNAGGPPFVEKVLEVNMSDWQTYFQSLFLTQIGLVTKYVPMMRANKFGRIVSISSSSIIEPIAGLVISNSIRSALSAWLKTLTFEVAQDGINITTVPIGRIETQRIKTLDANRAQVVNKSALEVMQNNCQNIPANRYGTTQEAANVILFLLSEYSSYVTGSLVCVDGGAIKSY